MQLPPSYPHKLLLEEYALFDTAEERLTWLMERKTSHAELQHTDMTPEKRVPGCVSGLWLRSASSSQVCTFHARSESPMVQGVVTFLCELYSGLSAQDVLALGSSIPSHLRLDGLLSTNRRRAVSSAVAFFEHAAQQQLGHSAAA